MRYLKKKDQMKGFLINIVNYMTLRKIRYMKNIS